MPRVTASWLAGCVFVLGMVPLAQGAAIPNGVQWNFLGTASVTLDDPNCCQPAISDGQKVLGTLTVVYPFPLTNPFLVSMAVNVYSLDGTQLLLSMSAMRPGDSINEVNGGPAVPGDAGGPDELQFSHDYIGSAPAAAEIGLQAPWSYWDIPSDGLNLIDLDGTAWSGVNPRTGDILPDTPPDASLFETRVLGFGAPVAKFPDASTVSNVSISVQIDQFLPEPGVTPLLAAAVLALAARRAVTQRLAVHSWL
jgi:hypothetical protein